jgi:Flp pilus assembly protein TadG
MSRARLDKRGVAAIEFALVAPVLILLALATTDVVQFLRSQLRLDATAVQLGQLVSQCNSITDTGDINRFWTYAQQIVGSLGTVTGANAQGAVIISAVNVPSSGSQSGKNTLAWQKKTGATQISSVGSTLGGTATIKEGFVVPAGQTLLVTEVFLPQQPWVLSARVMGIVPSKMLNGTTLFLTRAPDAPSIQTLVTNSSRACTS